MIVYGKNEWILYILKSFITNQLNKSNKNDNTWYAKKYLPYNNIKIAGNFLS